MAVQETTKPRQATLEARRRANQRWRDKNRDRSNYNAIKANATRFIKTVGSYEDVSTVVGNLNERLGGEGFEPDTFNPEDLPLGEYLNERLSEDNLTASDITLLMVQALQEQLKSVDQTQTA